MCKGPEGTPGAINCAPAQSTQTLLCGEQLQTGITRGAEELLGGMQSIVSADLQTLRALRLALGESLHLGFTQLARRGIGGLLIEDENCPGLICDALASNNGSSTYLCGAMVRLAKKSLSEDPSREFEAFRRSHGLPGNIVLRGSDAAGCGSQVLVLGEGISLLAALPDLSSARAGARMELKAIGGLLVLAEWLAQSQKESRVRDDAAKILAACPRRTAQYLASEIAEVSQCNREAGVFLSAMIARYFSGRISVGESFTFGKVASELAAAGPESPLELFYGWYNPAFKGAVGVPAENLTAERIADSDTVTAGAAGLLKDLCRSSSIAIGTSGWASRAAGQSDYFSVAAVADTRRGRDVRSLSMSVEKSGEIPAGPEKRELTRQLGVTASLYVTADLAMERSEDRALKSMHSRLQRTLSSMGNYIISEPARG